MTFQQPFLLIMNVENSIFCGKLGFLFQDSLMNIKLHKEQHSFGIEIIFCNILNVFIVTSKINLKKIYIYN